MVNVLFVVVHLSNREVDQRIGEVSVPKKLAKLIALDPLRPFRLRSGHLVWLRMLFGFVLLFDNVDMTRVKPFRIDAEGD